jgi:hypothetical protein
MTSKMTIDSGGNMNLQHVAGSTGPDGMPVVIADAQCTVIGSHATSGSGGVPTAIPLVKPAGATQIIIQAITGNVRFTLDGSTPTATYGFELQAGQLPVTIPVPGGGINVIQESATDLEYQWAA